jgi:hypothetical protein
MEQYSGKAFTVTKMRFGRTAQVGIGNVTYLVFVAAGCEPDAFKTERRRNLKGQ